MEQAVEFVCAQLGYPTLKDKQRQVIVNILSPSSSDVFATLPTGYGKSLCYGCLPGVFDQIRQSKGSIVIVVSPLLALMKNQVDSFAKKGVLAAYVSSEQEKECADEGGCGDNVKSMYLCMHVCAHVCVCMCVCVCW